MAVNFIGTRALTEALLPLMPPGSAVGTIASTAGYAWRSNLAALRALVATAGYQEALDWCARHDDLVGKGYNVSKEALILWTMTMGPRTIQRGVRINCICPGPTDTPMLEGIVADIGPAKVDAFAWPIGRRATPEEQAAPLLFLNSPAAGYVNGHALNVDGGLLGAAEAGVVDLAALLAEAMQSGASGKVAALV
jgi:NAD(P)-dependent dehydrogenase (short-subunit alcohol dehydrogenase family)